MHKSGLLHWLEVLLPGSVGEQSLGMGRLRMYLAVAVPCVAPVAPLVPTSLSFLDQTSPSQHRTLGVAFHGGAAPGWSLPCPLQWAEQELVHAA